MKLSLYVTKLLITKNMRNNVSICNQVSNITFTLQYTYVNCTIKYIDLFFKCFFYTFALPSHFKNCYRWLLSWSAVVGNVTSKCNGVTCYRFCLDVTAITFRTNNDLKIIMAITISCDNGSFMPRTITFEHNNFLRSPKASCDNARI